MTTKNKKTKENEADNATKCVADVIEAESKYLNLKEQEHVSGFAISGGGIRSASFGLGVMQALVANGQLEKMDYLSTVSGGGYLGAALTWALNQGGDDVGTTKEKFPLGKIRESSRQDKKAGNNQAEEEKHKEHTKAGHTYPDYTNNGLLDFIRQHSNYLMPTDGLGLFSFIGVVLRCIVLSLTIYFCMLTAVITVCKLCGLFGEEHGYVLFKSNILAACISSIPPFFDVSGVFIPICIILLLWYVFSVFTHSIWVSLSSQTDKLSEYLAFIRAQKTIGIVWKVGLSCFLIGTLPFVVGILGNPKTVINTAFDSTLYGVGVGIWQYIKSAKNEKSSSAMSGVIIYLAVFALVYGLLLMAYMASGFFFSTSPDVFHLKAFLFFCLVVFILGRYTNLNIIGPHRIWRDRLMEAFMPDRDAIKENNWKPAKKADSGLMENMCSGKHKRPYHIINTNVILANSKEVKYRGRGGDNFMISPLFCGSEATQWCTTNTFQKKESRGMTLSTAMATSAAALNPDAGVSGAGFTRNTVVSILLSALNLRLGYWTGNPSKHVWSFAPNFFVPGLSTEILRSGFRETDIRILLSDGGHFENLALYELVRRKLHLIIVSDGGEDGGFNFDDLANAVEKVRVDFGTKIVFKDKNGEGLKADFGLNGILFNADGRNAFQKKYEIAERGFAIADVHYNDGSMGTLVYLKLAMVNELPTDVYSYKGLNPTFPHQSTADQFFDEKQFEAYRELGYTIAWKMMESPEGKEALGLPA